MPLIAYYKNILFFIFSGEAMKEPPHLHFSKSRDKRHWGKIWINNLEIVKHGDFDSKELNLIQKLVHKNKDLLIEKYYEASKGKTKPIQLHLK